MGNFYGHLKNYGLLYADGGPPAPPLPTT